MLTLRRGTVVDVESHLPGPEQRLTVEVGGARRQAIADVGLVVRAFVAHAEAP